MSKKEHLVCHSAQCNCQFGDFPDILSVSTQNKHYINDTNGAQKLIATHMDIGQPFTVNTFGQCKLQPTGSSFKPCQPMITAWDGFYDKVQIDQNGGYPLLESSKATCAIAGSPCVSLITHGQVAMPSASNFEETSEDRAIAQQLNPVPTTPIMGQKKELQFSTDITANDSESEESEYTLESTYVHDHFKEVAQENINNFEADTTSVVYQLYKKIADGVITNPSIEVIKKPDSNQLVNYEACTKTITVWENSLENIADDIDKKIRLIQGLTEAYSTHINNLVKDDLSIEDEIETYEYDLFRFDGINDTKVIIGKLSSPNYTGDLIIDVPEKPKAPLKKWVNTGGGQQSVHEVYNFDSFNFQALTQKVHTFKNPKKQPRGWPPTVGLKFSFSLNGGFTASVYAGTSYQVGSAGDAHLMSSVNAALTYYGNGSPGTSEQSPHLINASITPSLTLGYKTGNALNLNLFNSFTGSGVNVPYEYAFTLGTTGVLSSGKATRIYDEEGNVVKNKYNKHDHNHRHQLIGGAGIKIGNFMISSYNDIYTPFLFYGMNSDQYWSAGVQLQAKLKNQMYMSYAFDLYYGKSNNDNPYLLDKQIDGQNYDYQSLFDVLLNRGQETFTTIDAAGINNTQTKFGYGTFWPSNMMHNAIAFPEVPKPPKEPKPEKYKKPEKFKEAKEQYNIDLEKYNQKMEDYTLSIQLTPNPTFHHLFVTYKNGEKKPSFKRINTYMNADMSVQGKSLREFFALDKKFKQK